MKSEDFGRAGGPHCARAFAVLPASASESSHRRFSALSRRRPARPAPIDPDTPLMMYGHVGGDIAVMIDAQTSRVVVTGASGFVGANLVRRLLAHEIKVQAWARNGSESWRLRGLEGLVNFAPVELTDADAIVRAIAGFRPTHVFHLATARKTETPEERRATMMANVMGTSTLVEACRQLGVTSLVYTASSMECARTAEPMREDAALSPIDFYTSTKAAALLIAQERAQTLGASLTILRLFSVYGPWESPKRLVPSLARALLCREPFRLTPPGIRRDFVYVEDVVDALLLAAERRGNGGEIFHIGSGVETSNEEVVEHMQAVTERRLDIEVGAYSPHATDTDHWVANIAKARTVLGWQPAHDLDAGLRKTHDWWAHRLQQGGGAA